MKGIGIQLKGVQFLADEHGNCKSVAIDLDIWRDLWEDFYDGMLAEIALQEDGPYTPWETLEAELDAKLAAINAADSAAADD